ncbi:TPR repeat protein [Vulgatibacter incomptus]|uniref:TPR repeat protein n=1 Tax=Vulgatibacter incomptus TaxID=1391653 RepID=A0A0K1P9A7_9BACT|nr:TPR repeat protein [Vulgatibacter incomptus]
MIPAGAPPPPRVARSADAPGPKRTKKPKRAPIRPIGRRTLILAGSGAAVLAVAAVTGYLLLGDGANATATASAPLVSQVAAELDRDHFAAAKKALLLAESQLDNEPEDGLAHAMQARVAIVLQHHFGADSPTAAQARSKIASADVSRPGWLEAVAAASFAAGEPNAQLSRLEQELTRRPGDRDLLALLAEGSMLAGKPEAAEAWLLQLLGVSPKSPLALHGLGLLKLRSGDPSAAATRFEAALEADPRHASSAVELARIALSKGELDEAVRQLSRGLEKDAAEGLGPRDRSKAELLFGDVLARTRKPAEAEAAFRRALALDAKSADVRRALAGFLLSRHRNAEVIELLPAAEVRGDPSLVETSVVAYLALGKMIDADGLVRALIEKKGDQSRSWYLQGLVQAKAGNEAEAVRSFERAVELEPDGIEALLALARAEREAGKLDQAKAALARAEEKAPQSHRIKTALGELRLAQGDAKSAVQAFDEALRLDASDVEALEGKGRVLEKLGDLEGALAAYQTATSIDDSSIAGHLGAGSLLARKGDANGAVEALEKAKALDPKSPRIRIGLATLRLDAGELDPAMEEVEAALTSDESSAGAWALRSRILRARGEGAAAVDAIRRAVAIEPKRPAWALELGAAFEAAANPTEALAAYRKALGLAPRSADALEGAGRVLLALGGTADAVKSLESALAADPARTRLHVPIGDGYMRMRRFPNAIAAYLQAAKQPDAKGIAFKLARAYQEEGKSSEAIAQFQRALKEDPDDSNAWRYLGFAYKEKNRLGEAIGAFKTYLEKSPKADDRAEIEDEIATLRL